MVKTVKHELKVDDTLFQCHDVLTSFIFIELSNSSLGEDLTPLPLLMKLSKGILQSDAYLLSKPSTHVGNIQSVVFCLHVMLLPGQTLNELQTLENDKILL
jgi:hypothetical protein